MEYRWRPRVQRASIEAPYILHVLTAEIADILEAYFAREGFRVARACNGESALIEHARLKPDLVILDIRMPEADGIEVLGEIRRRGTTPVIMATALAEDVDKLLALRMGADDYVVRMRSASELSGPFGASAWTG
jgi:DNA-binding response OmpR family regulator